MINVVFRRFAARYFGWLAKIFYLIKISFELKKSNLPIVLILTPGKVGSSTLYFNLKKYFKGNVYHIHRISKIGIEKSKIEHLLSDRKSIPLHLIIAEILSKKIDFSKDNVIVISIIREPISRSISSFFQNIDFHRNTIESNNLKIDTEASLLMLKDILNESICSDLEDWFKTEVEDVLKIDPFVLSKNSNLNYVANNGSFILFRMEDMKMAWLGIVERLFKTDFNFPLSNYNIGGMKYYSDSYSFVKNKIRLEQNVFDSIVHHRFYKTFYSDKIESSKSKWVNYND